MMPAETGIQQTARMPVYTGMTDGLSREAHG